MTREDVLRQMLAIDEGALYRERDVQASVQTMLRSRLFRSVEVQSLAGGRPDTRYLVFTVVEGEPVSIDLRAQTLTLHNLDLNHWPDDLDEIGRAHV